MEQDLHHAFSTINRARQGQDLRLVTVDYESQTTETDWV